jgi:hypothetical protein
MTSITQVSDAMNRVLNTVAQTAARRTGFVKRESKLNGPIFAKTMVFGCLGSPATKLDELSQSAACFHLQITPQGLDDRFKRAAATFMQEVLNGAVTELIAAEGVAVPLLQRFSAVEAIDGSSITLPPELEEVWRGCGGSTAEGNAAVKIEVRLDLLSGALHGPLLQDGRAHDQSSPIHQAPVAKKVLRLADLGFFDLDKFQEIQTQDAYFLTRLKVQTSLFDPSGEQLVLPSFLRGQPTNEVDVPVLMGASHRLPVRLLAIRVTQEVASERRRKLKAEARRKGQTVSKARLELADWTILVTNVPGELLSLKEALVLARARWQIELLFKLWKEHGRIDECRSKKPWRILCEFYAKLIAMLIQHWIFLVGCWQNPDRSLVKAADTVRSAAFALAIAVDGAIDLTVVIDRLAYCLSVGCCMNPRKKKPNTYQLLLGVPNVA